MKIVLVELGDQQDEDEREFELLVVKVGRDPAQCHVVFDRTLWPMVSRHHAEFHLAEGRCLLIDTNSSFGTFLDNQFVREPTEVRVGASVQFGAGGPVLRVVSIETSVETRAPEDFVTRVHYEEGNVSPATHPPIPAPSLSPLPAQPAAPYAVLELESTSSKPERIRLGAEKVLLGRDPASAIPIEAAAAVVSRRHAEIQRREEQFALVDLDSFNGTLLNNQRITTPVTLHDGDRIQLGPGGPVLRFIDPSHPALAGEQGDDERRDLLHRAGGFTPAHALSPTAEPHADANTFYRTIVSIMGERPPAPPSILDSGVHAQLLIERSFYGKPQLTVGRAPGNDIRLDGLQISNYHARFLNEEGSVIVEDTGSTNGVYVNGARINGRQSVRSQDVVKIGHFVLKADPQHGIAVHDTRSKTRLDAVDINKWVRNRANHDSVKLLDGIDFVIQPNEFVGVLGPSGAGKSSLLGALNGMHPAQGGRVYINGLDLYQHLDSLKQSIGYVPQDDIIHRELTVYRTLYYVARLRLSRDVSEEEVEQIIGEVLDVTGLAERRDLPIAELSGGQRKRVSIAVELITKPSVIFLDEPTSGLDPATEEKIMKLFRQIAESGHTVVLTTHTMENVRLFDKVIILIRGKLIFYGTPREALAHVGAADFKELYDKLEAPVETELSNLSALPSDATAGQKIAYEEYRRRVAETAAEEWKLRFQRTELYERHIAQPLAGLQRDAPPRPVIRSRLTINGSVRQLATLARRYVQVLRRDKFNLSILFGQALVIALFTWLVVGVRDPRDFPYFVLALVSLWLGTSIAAREIVRERAIYKRERMVNLELLPYVGSKLLVLSLIVSAQCILLFGTLKILPMSLPGRWGGVPHLLVMVLTGMVGIALGLFVSAVVKTSEMATSLVPLILIPQILFSGLVNVPTGVARVIGATMPASWSFDEMKRLSALDTLEEEGSNPNGKTRGRGLYKHIEESNVERVQDELDNYRQGATEKIKEYERRMKEYLGEIFVNPNAIPPEAPVLDASPVVSPTEKLSEHDLSGYVRFKHRWGHIALNPLVLLGMFGCLIGATVIALRRQDPR